MVISSIDRRLRSSWGWILALGLISLVGGIFALANPFAATLAATMMAGWTFAALGLFQIVHAFRVQGWGGFIWALLFGVLSLLVGISLIFNPLGGMVSLTLLVAALFIVIGIVKGMYAMSLRPMPGWGWALASALLSLVLGAIIIADFPFSATQVLGILLAVELLSNGVAFVLVAMALRKA